MILSIIAAASENNVIGKNNQLVWKLPNDMKYFKNKTWGMPVIMGRKTFESMEGEPLPGRFNFVVSRRSLGPGGHQTHLTWAFSVDQAIELAKQTDCKEVFVIGGGQIYKETIQLADKIYLTRVHALFDGDSFFPVIDTDLWRLESSKDFPADSKNAYPYSFQVWVRKANE